MPNLPISGLASSAANIAATDLLPVVQTSGVGPVKMTGLQLAGGLLGSTALTGATVTTSKPVLDLSQTWGDSNVTFTGLKFNAAGSSSTNSASGSLLLDLQVGAASAFNVNKVGNVRLGTDASGTNTATTVTVGGSRSTGSGYGQFNVDLAVPGSSGTSANNLGTAAYFKYATSGRVELALNSSGGYSSIVSEGNSLYLALDGNHDINMPSIRALRNGGGLYINTGGVSYFTSPSTATLQLGAADAAAPVAQTLQVQSVVAGTTNTAGTNFTIKGSAGTGTGAGGSIIFQVAPAGTTGTSQNALATALTISSTQQVIFTAGSAASTSLTWGAVNTGWYSRGNNWAHAVGGTQIMEISGGGTASISIIAPAALSFGLNPASNPPDVFLYRDAANTLALRNGANAQTFNVYGTYTDAANYKRGTLSFKTYSAVDYVSLTAEADSGNIGVVLQPKGTGAITAQIPDGTTTGGNARGTNAVDLQTVRSAATQVASGNSSFVAGLNCTASGSNGAIALGRTSVASGEVAVALGEGATASSTYSVAVGNATSSALLSFAAQNANASANFAFGLGRSTSLDKISQFGVGTERFSANDIAQYSTLILSGSTTDATPTALTIRLYSTSTGQTRATVPASTTWAFTAHISGRSGSGTDNAYYIRQGVIKRDGSNNTALVGTVQTIGTDIESDAAWDIAVTADDTNECLLVTVTGKAATNIRWLAKVDLVEIGYP